MFFKKKLQEEFYFSYRLVEECPLATLRDRPDGITNPHVQNLMVSVTRPLYLECT